MYDYEVIKKKLIEKDYLLYEDGRLNIVGFRQGTVADKFEDWISILFKDEFGWHSNSWKATTRPGIPWLLKPMNPNGTAILVPGQYVEAYSLGLHKGKKALIQVEKVKVYRDDNRDSTWDENKDSIEEGYFGINIHRPGFMSKTVGLNSAGCQVFEDGYDFDEFMWWCWKQAETLKNRFTYTLMEI